MLIYLVHPQHGTHIVYTPFELEKCLSNGWKPRDEETKDDVLIPLSQIDKPKRGRPKKVKA